MYGRLPLHLKVDRDTHSLSVLRMSLKLVATCSNSSMTMLPLLDHLAKRFREEQRLPAMGSLVIPLSILIFQRFCVAKLTDSDQFWLDKNRSSHSGCCQPMLSKITNT